MKKWFKRLFLFTVFLLLLVVAGAFVADKVRKQQPEWYAQITRQNPAEQAEAARRAHDKLSSTVDWAAKSQAAETRERLGTEPDRTTELQPPPEKTRQVRFTEEELNGLFSRWSQSPEINWDQTYGKHLADPAVVLHGGRLVLAGTVTELENMVVSLHFNPTMTPTGDLSLDLERVMAGRLPMPQVFFDKYREQLVDKLAAALPGYQSEAELAEDGSVNTAAINAAMGKLLLNVLNHRPSEPVLFVRANQGDSVPVKLSAIALDERSITLSVGMMTAEERQAFIDDVRRPYPLAVPAVE